jgi:hypothetical protein
VLALVSHALIRRPERTHEFQALVEDRLIVLERHMEREVFAPVIAAPGRKIDAAVAQEIKRRPLLGDTDGMVQRQNRDRGSEADMPGACRDVGEHEVRTREHAERIEMVFADPGRMHPELVGVKRLGSNVVDQLIGRAGIVLIMIVAQGEVAEFHFAFPSAFVIDLNLK